jgi:hypothetical protein
MMQDTNPRLAIKCLNEENKELSEEAIRNQTVALTS